MTFKEVQRVINKYKKYGDCEQYNVTGEVQQFLFSFLSNEKAEEMYKMFEKRSNIGANHGYHKGLKRYVVQIEYHPV